MAYKLTKARKTVLKEYTKARKAYQTRVRKIWKQGYTIDTEPPFKTSEVAKGLSTARIKSLTRGLKAQTTRELFKTATYHGAPAEEERKRRRKAAAEKGAATKRRKKFELEQRKKDEKEKAKIKKGGAGAAARQAGNVSAMVFDTISDNLTIFGYGNYAAVLDSVVDNTLGLGNIYIPEDLLAAFTNIAELYQLIQFGYLGAYFGKLISAIKGHALTPEEAQNIKDLDEAPLPAEETEGLPTTQSAETTERETRFKRNKAIIDNQLSALQYDRVPEKYRSLEARIKSRKFYYDLTDSQMAELNRAVKLLYGYPGEIEEGIKIIRRIFGV